MEPLLLSVRFHPHLLIESREKELSKERWASSEPHDFFAVSQKISIEEEFNSQLLVRNGVFPFEAMNVF